MSMPDFPLSMGELDKLNNFWEFDDCVTAKLNGFSGVPDYYHKASCKQFLKTIETPTHIIHAKDDPFFDTTMIPSDSELSEFVTLELSPTGGHVGFVSGSAIASPVYWLDNRIAELIIENSSIK